MKIAGKPCGTIFPKSSINVEVCMHRYGALASISHCTDRLYDTSRYAAELFGFKYNIGLTAFTDFWISMLTDLSEAEKTGRIKFGVYQQTWIS